MAIQFRTIELFPLGTSPPLCWGGVRDEMERIDPEAAEHGKGETDRQTDGQGLRCLQWALGISTG